MQKYNDGAKPIFASFLLGKRKAGYSVSPPYVSNIPSYFVYLNNNERTSFI